MATAFPLTPLQNSMFLSAELTKRPWHYLEQIVVDVPNERLDADAMGRAWSELLMTHPELRSVVETANEGRLMQRMGQAEPIAPVLFDWSKYDPSIVSDKFATFLADERNAGIGAKQYPNFRVAIFVLGPDQSKLVWTFPHHLLDGRCFAALLDEVFQRYRRILDGDQTKVSSSAAPSVFEQHCRQLADMSHSDGIAYYSSALAGWEGSDGLLRHDAEASRKTFTTRYLSKDQSLALHRLADQADVSLSTVILAAWGVVLARSTGQEDVVFGNIRNGRHLVSGSKNAVGCFITTVPMRLKLNPGLTLGDVLKQVRADQISSRAHEHTPLTEIRKQLDVPPTRQIFESVVMFDNATLDAQLKALGADWADRDVELLEEGDTPITVAAYSGPQLRIDFEFDPAQVPGGDRLGAQLIQFLAALETAEPETQMAMISFLSSDEMSTMYDLAGASAEDDAFFSCIDRFEQSALVYPDKIAVLQPEQEPMTYAALDAAANSLAHQLIKANVGVDDIVGICIARSAAFITAMLATWKAGAAFVPLDPSYPVDTLNIIVKDSAARLVLTDDTAPNVSAETLVINQNTALARSADKPKRSEMEPDQPAYIIFTSGTTGRPKGVMVSHRSLASHSAAVNPLFELSPEDRVLQFAALSFDVALEEIVPTLLSGATLVLRSDEMSRSIDVFLKVCRDLKTTVINLPTGFWVVLTEELDSRDLQFPPLVRLVIVGGERVPLSVLRRWRKRLPDIRWINGYGPTETTITCTAYSVIASDLDGDSVPIGRSLAHARAWVLSRDGALQSEGVEGQLFISGPAVALGYMNDPVRTAQSFLTAEFDPDIGRIYATGDRVIWRDGQLLYLGRMDRQIKLRGFRIEPGQIESTLESQEGVDRAYAALHTPQNGSPQLVAWYSTAVGEAAIEPDILQGWVANLLPPQMQPILVAVSDWPQTPGGKIDVARLPVPEQSAVAEGLDSAAATPLTRDVAEIFSELLQNQEIRPDTSFFDAGGDSLQLLRLLPVIEEKFGIHIKPTALYADPTPRGVVRALQDQDPDPLVVIPIQTNGDRPPLYGIHVLGDNGSFFRPLAAELGAEQPVYGLTVGLLSESTPMTVADIAHFYLCQIERHYPVGPLSLISVSAGSYVALELAQRLLKAGRDVQALILLDAEGPGGRSSIGRAGRMIEHQKNIFREGWPYVSKLLAAMRSARRHDAAMAKLKSAQDGAEAATKGKPFDVTDFVAANTIAIEEYEPKPYPRLLTIFRASANRFDSPKTRETGLGWQPVAAGGFDVWDVPGDHLGILEPPNVQTLATRIAALLQTKEEQSS